MEKKILKENSNSIIKNEEENFEGNNNTMTLQSFLPQSYEYCQLNTLNCDFESSVKMEKPRNLSPAFKVTSNREKPRNRLASLDRQLVRHPISPDAL